MSTNNEISLYVDLMIAEALLGDDSLSKTAQASGIASSMVDKIRHYVGNNIDPDDKAGSLLNLIVPGVLPTLFGSIGLGWLGWLLGLAFRFFHIDVSGILKSIWGKLKEMLSDGKQTTSQQVDAVVQSSVQEHLSPATQEEADRAAELTKADDGAVKSVAMQLREAKLLRLALEEYKKITLEKKAAPAWFTAYSQKKSATGSLLGKILSLFFRVAIASAGLMVAGDVLSKLVGRPSALDDTVQKGKPVSDSVSSGGSIPTTSGAPWIVSATNSPSGISTMLQQFAKELYPGILDGKEGVLENDPTFRTLVDTIAWYNHASSGGPIVYIPKMFSSKKQLVDSFMNDVMAKTKAPGA